MASSAALTLVRRPMTRALGRWECVGDGHVSVHRHRGFDGVVGVCAGGDAVGFGASRLDSAVNDRAARWVCVRHRRRWVRGCLRASGGCAAGSTRCPLALTAEAWPDPARVRVRMGLHTGEVQERGGRPVLGARRDHRRGIPMGTIEFRAHRTRQAGGSRAEHAPDTGRPTTEATA